MNSSQLAPATPPESAFASLGSRIAAQFIDMVTALSILLAAGFSLRLLRSFGLWTPTEGADPVSMWHELGFAPKAGVIVAYIVSMGLFYFAFLESSSWQASIGKRLLSIHVTDVHGRRLRLPQSFGRAIAKCFLNVWIGFFLSILCIAASRRRQALHDFAARTVVRSGRPTASDSLEPWRLLAAIGTQYLWLVLTFAITFG